MTSGMSQRSISPSLLSSVKLPTSGVTMLPWYIEGLGGAVHSHWTSGVNESAGALSLQGGSASGTVSETLQTCDVPPEPTLIPPPAPPIPRPAVPEVGPTAPEPSPPAAKVSGSAVAPQPLHPDAPPATESRRRQVDENGRTAPWMRVRQGEFIASL